MEKIIFAVLILFSQLSWSSVSFSHAQELYYRIAMANHLAVVPTLVYDSTDEVNASQSGFRITLNRGILKFARNDAEMALVLGHELAHYELGHRNSTPSNEYAADAQGAIYMSNAGYSICQGAELLRRFHSKGSSTHPDSDSRFHRICH